MDEKLKEMAKTMCCDYGNCKQCFMYKSEETPCTVEEDCEKLYNAGYRKESDTAREILQKGKYCMPSGLRDWIEERYSVDGSV